MSRERSWILLCLSLFYGLCDRSLAQTGLLKRAFIDPGQCESFCLSSGFQGRFGNCDCGYVMFEKRSGPTDQYQHHHHQTTENTLRDPVIAELSDQEIMEALNIIEKVRKNQEDTEVLTDDELALFLWLLTRVET